MIDSDDESHQLASSTKTHSRYVLFASAIALTLAGAVGIAWWQRTTIASHFIDQAFAERGVPARYAITRLTPVSANLEQIVIGHKARPDFTAQQARVSLRWTLRGPVLSHLHLQDAMLHARIDEEGLHMGFLDKFRAPPSTPAEPFSLPDLAVTLDNVRALIETPAGPAGAAAEGSGHLSNGFRGRIALVAPQLRYEECGLSSARLISTVQTHRRSIRLKGPAQAKNLRCGDVTAGQATADITLEAAETFDRAKGRVKLALKESQLTSRLRISTLAADTHFKLNGLLPRSSSSHDKAESTIESAMQWTGLVAGSDVKNTLHRATTALTTTPIAPLAEKASTALSQALDGNQGHVNITATYAPGGHYSADISDLHIQSKSRARLASNGLLARWIATANGPARILPGNSRLLLSGGGFPSVSLVSTHNDQPVNQSAAWQINGEISPYDAGQARIGRTPFTLTHANGETSLNARLLLDGPIGDGRITGLSLPLDLAITDAGDMRIKGESNGCLNSGFTHLSVAGVTAGPHRFELCQNGPKSSPLFTRAADGTLRADLKLAETRFAGRFNNAPLNIQTKGVTATLSGNSRSPSASFVTGATDVRMNTADGDTWLRFAALRGKTEKNALTGRIEQIAGKIAQVPLVASETNGTWRLNQGIVTLISPAARITDAETERRFEPVLARDLTLRLEGGTITGDAFLTRPANEDRLAHVVLRHRLSDTSGEAVLDVPRLTFGDRLQPESLTPLTLGIIANVGGTISGKGTIRWADGTVTSDGVFETPGIGLSAAFGQVHRIKGQIVFNDLLGMTTPPGQQVTLGEINTGLALKDGTIRYQLLADRHVHIEEGLWSFAGGDLVLEPTLLDFSQPTDRIFSLKVVGLDAALFIEQFNFRNFAATGTFDGKMPLLFNEKGGRIVGGRLVARRPGGTLAYVGELSEADLGGAGKMAFDALKSLKYNALIVEMDGDLDGEIVSNILFSGINQSPVNPSGGSLPVTGTGFPFRFNISVKAPFRSLLNTAESFTDVGNTVKSSLPPDTSVLPGAGPVVQPPVSPGTAK